MVARRLLCQSQCSVVTHCFFSVSQVRNICLHRGRSLSMRCNLFFPQAAAHLGKIFGPCMSNYQSIQQIASAALRHMTAGDKDFQLENSVRARRSRLDFDRDVQINIPQGFSRLKNVLLRENTTRYTHPDKMDARAQKQALESVVPFELINTTSAGCLSMSPLSPTPRITTKAYIYHKQTISPSHIYLSRAPSL